MSTLVGLPGDWRPVPLDWTVDLARGGRWTSLRSADREWLWTNPDRRTVAARDALTADPAGAPAFVDAGGGEECWPTVRGEPDHGAAWSRPWSGRPADAEVTVAGIGSLRRRIAGAGVVTVDYELTGPASGFVHAVHLLLDLSPAARLLVPGAPAMWVLDSDDPDRRWPDGLDRLGPDDGSAVCAVLLDTSSATVLDGRHALRLTWQSPDLPEHHSLMLWRNLRGWPEQHPYRSIGIEPMLGRAADRRTAADDDLARVGPSGRTRWTLQLEALTRFGRPA
ncbi:MAG TPA: hypothetical protein VFU98_19095 [Microlunatus sp.]|nr:hypothetical protein [Microlunatus sp.]